MKFKASANQQPVERFLGKLHEAMEFVKQRLLMFLYEQGHEPSLFRRRKRAKQSPRRRPDDRKRPAQLQLPRGHH